MKVLIADDEEPLRKLIGLSLQRDPRLEILYACDGQEAVEVAAAEHPDLVLLDVRMPRLDGYQACARIRQDPMMASKKVMMLSALQQESDIKLGIEAGADAHLSKPFKPSELLDSVLRILGLGA